MAAHSYLGFYEISEEEFHETNFRIQRIRDHESVLGAFEIIQQSPSMPWRFFRLLSEDPIDPQTLVNDTGAAFYFGETLEALFQDCSFHPDACLKGHLTDRLTFHEATIKPRRRSLWDHIQED